MPKEYRPHAVGELDLLEQVLHPFRGPDHPAREGSVTADTKLSTPRCMAGPSGGGRRTLRRAAGPHDASPVKQAQARGPTVLPATRQPRLPNAG